MWLRFLAFSHVCEGSFVSFVVSWFYTEYACSFAVVPTEKEKKLVSLHFLGNK